MKGFGHENGPRRREPWRGANQPFKLWVKTLAAAGVPYLEMYALRHSSIVRQLRAGLPVRLVAANHDTSSIMIERHYAAFVVSALDDLTRQAIVPIASAEVRGSGL